jgi:hypothetical protein
MAVHHCARYCKNPKAHELAVKWIVQYLLAMKDKGLLLRPTPDGNLDMFVDADFAGWWHKEYSHLHENVLSCTGFVITFCGCPITWGSKLQTEIALSTTESKYIALSTAIREILPLRQVLQDIMKYSFLHLSSSKPDNIKNLAFQSSLSPSKVYEDNNACIILSTWHKLQTPYQTHISQIPSFPWPNCKWQLANFKSRHRPKLGWYLHNL